jgi:hypothetical protein
MNVEDLVILERIERLAFQAGAAGKSAEPAKRELGPVARQVLKKIVKVHEDNRASAGPALFAYAPEDNLNWEDIHALAAEVAND